MILRVLAVLFLIIVAAVTYSFMEFRSHLHQVYVAPDPYTLAAPQDADITVVDFLDYGCDACREMHPVLMEAVKRDGKVRYIPRPIISKEKPINRNIILLLCASARQEALPLIHEKIIEAWPVEDIKVLTDYAASIGLDMKTLEDDMASADVAQALEINRVYFDEWGLKALPTVLVATKFAGTRAIYVPRQDEMTADEFVEKFKEIRTSWF